MKHPREILLPEYAADLAQMQITRMVVVSAAVDRLLRYEAEGRYAEVSAATGVPVLFMAPSFEREASSDFSRSPAQGDPWNYKSVNVPANRGPFPNWAAAARDAYALNGLDKVGAENWTWPLLCYYGELFNGFGPRDVHRIRTSYLWGGTNLQQRGKYVRDHVYDATVMDPQIGIIPMAMLMAVRRPALALPGTWPFPPVDAPSIVPVPLVLVKTGMHDALWVQQSLNKLDFGPLVEDGNYGRKTEMAVRAFQAAHGLDIDGVAGPRTAAAMELALI